ncbi:MAG TPA: terminase family protein [candidate division Zixibacteria bacterium]|nr:terminase family protein [candidate division Zixibacteria bacterium]
METATQGSDGWRGISRAEWARALADPVFFARRLLGVELHDGQARWLRNSAKRQNVLVTGNRWGKSFGEAVKALYYALFQVRDRRFDRAGRYRVVTASITQDQANIIWNEAVRLARSSPVIEPLIQEITRTPFPRLMLGNGSVIESRSAQNRGEYLLGNDYDFFIFDEVAFEPHADFVVNEVILMRLADREGRLDLVSTPNGKNWLYHQMRELSLTPEVAYTQTGDSRDNPHISADYLKQRVALFSADRVAQNIMGQFVDSGREIVASEYIDSALARAAAGVNLPDEPHYLSGWDLARKRTATVGVTVALTAEGGAHVVAVERLARMDWNFVFERIRARQRRFPGRLALDATGLGDVVVSQLADLAPIPFLFTEKSKAGILTYLELMHVQERLSYERWELKSADGRVWSLEDELRAACWDNNGRFDGVMALALALWPLAENSATPRVAPRVSVF